MMTSLWRHTRLSDVITSLLFWEGKCQVIFKICEQNSALISPILWAFKHFKIHIWMKEELLIHSVVHSSYFAKEKRKYFRSFLEASNEAQCTCACMVCIWKHMVCIAIHWNNIYMHLSARGGSWLAAQPPRSNIHKDIYPLVLLQIFDFLVLSPWHRKQSDIISYNKLQYILETIIFMGLCNESAWNKTSKRDYIQSICKIMF